MKEKTDEVETEERKDRGHRRGCLCGGGLGESERGIEGEREREVNIVLE